MPTNTDPVPRTLAGMDEQGHNRRRNRRGQGALLREDILTAAVALIERDGHAGNVTLRRIAREAEITAPSIYAHFENLDDILRTVLDRYFDELRDAITAASVAEADAGPDEALLRGCRAYARFAVERPGRYRALFARTNPPTDPAAYDEDARPGGPRLRRLDVFQPLIDAVAATTPADGSDRPAPFEEALAVWAALHGAVLLRLSMPLFPWTPLSPFIDMVVARTARLGG